MNSIQRWLTKSLTSGLLTLSGCVGKQFFCCGYEVRRKEPCESLLTLFPIEETLVIAYCKFSSLNHQSFFVLMKRVVPYYELSRVTNIDH